MQQLLILETLIKGSVGLLLLVAPAFSARLSGLPRVEGATLWPRLLGAALVGIAAAAFIEARVPATHGLGIGGLVAINLVAAFVVFSALVMKAGAPTWRGRMLLWLTIGLLLLLALIEISYA